MLTGKLPDDAAPKKKKTGRPDLDPSGSHALHFRIPADAGAVLTAHAGSAPGARSKLARRLLLSAMRSEGLIP